MEINFSNPQQREFYYCTARNQCFSGGYNNGKTFSGCLKAFTLLSTFPNYRMAIARQTRVDLMKTTYQTFNKICPPSFVHQQNLQEGYTTFKNGSTIYWLHLDSVDESTLRGLEINSYLVDQAEEIDEKIFDTINARLGRWDNAEVPEELLKLNPDWPVSAFSGKKIAPSYGMLLCNPDTQYHFIYRKFHPESLERNLDFAFIEGEWDSKLGSTETYEQALGKDEEWVNRFVKGQWGISQAQIHRVWPESLIEPDEDFVKKVISKGNLYRVLDHGETSPTACLWAAALNNVFIFYREYYTPNQVISYHRQAINDLSDLEYYSGNYADPSIFRKANQKDGAFWTVADEYLTSDIEGKGLAWQPADNNEFATRNRINELLKPSLKFIHPITGVSPAPGIYFIKRSETYPFGCFHSINELGSQRRELIGYFNGKATYSDDRVRSVADHAYDCVRYFVAQHGSSRVQERKPPPKASFEHLRRMRAVQKMKRMQQSAIV